MHQPVRRGEALTRPHGQRRRLRAWSSLASPWRSPLPCPPAPHPPRTGTRRLHHLGGVPGASWTCRAAGARCTARPARVLLRHALAVPLDPAAPGSDDIVLQLVRVHRSGGSEVKAPLLLIAGGPGQSGVELATSSVAMLPDALLDRFDLVGFDPRGVGSSQPIACVHSEPVPRTFPDLLTDDGFRRSAEEIRTFADECAASLGARASLFSTTATPPTSTSSVPRSTSRR